MHAMILRKEQSRIGLFAVVVLSVLVFAADKREQQFTGVISDSQCAYNIHSQTHSHREMLKMHTMGESEADCVKTCVKIGRILRAFKQGQQSMAIERSKDPG